MMMEETITYTKSETLVGRRNISNSTPYNIIYSCIINRKIEKLSVMPFVYFISHDLFVNNVNDVAAHSIVIFFCLVLFI